MDIDGYKSWAVESFDAERGFRPQMSHEAAVSETFTKDQGYACLNLLHELLVVSDDNISGVLEAVKPILDTRLVKKEHVERVISCVKERKSSVPASLDALAYLATRIEGAADMLRQMEFMEIVVAYLGDVSCTGYLPGVFALLFIALKAPETATRPAFEAGLHECLLARLDREFAVESSSVLICMSRSVPPESIRVFVEDLFIRLSEDDLQPEVLANVLQCFHNVQATGYRIEKYLEEERLVENVTAFMGNKNPDVQVACLEVLSGLCAAGDRMLRTMISFGTICGARRALESDNSIVMKAALGFFLAWTHHASEGYHLFDQISEMDFVHICKNSTYETKRDMMNLIMTITSKAEPVYITRLLSESFLDAFMEQTTCLCQEACEQTFQILAQACSRSSADAAFIQRVNAVLSRAEFDSIEGAQMCRSIVATLH